MKPPMPYHFREQCRQRAYEDRERELRRRGPRCELGDLDPEHADLAFALMSVFGGGIGLTFYRKKPDGDRQESGA